MKVVSQAIEKTVARKMAKSVGKFLFSYTFDDNLSHTVNIRFVRYVVRDADGKKDIKFM